MALGRDPSGIVDCLPFLCASGELMLPVYVLQFFPAASATASGRQLSFDEVGPVQSVVRVYLSLLLQVRQSQVHTKLRAPICLPCVQSPSLRSMGALGLQACRLARCAHRSYL